MLLIDVTSELGDINKPLRVSKARGLTRNLPQLRAGHLESEERAESVVSVLICSQTPLPGALPWACSVPPVKVTGPQNTSQKSFSFQILIAVLSPWLFRSGGSYKSATMSSRFYT